MANHQNRQERITLPPLDQLRRAFRECPSGCITLFADDHELRRHIHASHSTLKLDVDMGNAPDETLKQYKALPMQSYRPSVQQLSELPSPAPSTCSDSECSFGMFTPVNSRAPSLAPSDRRLSGPGPIRTGRRGKRASVSNAPDFYGAPASDDGKVPCHDKKTKKMRKEQQSRAEHAAVLCRTEDMFRNYLGYDRKEQSGGNGNGAGLYACKLPLLRGNEAVLQHVLDAGYRAALSNGRLAEWQANMLEIVEGATHAQPFAGTLLEFDQDQACGHADSKSKECVTHGHPDWRECRRLHAQNRFEINVRSFQSQLRRRQG